MKSLNTIKSVIKIELFLSITLFLLPIVLPFSSGEILGSISEYGTLDFNYVYIIMLTLISLMLIYSGLINDKRKFNIFLGLLLFGVLIFPVSNYRFLHNTFAISFFILNILVLYFFSNVLTIINKIVLGLIILIVLYLFFTRIITLFIAESIGVLILSLFFLISHFKI